MKVSLLFGKSDRTSFKWGILFFPFLVAQYACSSLQPVDSVAVQKNDYSSLKTHIAAVSKDLMSEKKIQGLSLAVVDDQKIVYTDGFGYASKSAGINASPNTLYGIGSISKLFTAIAIMKLAEEGKIDIDKPLKTYLSDFSIKSRYQGAPEITIRQILTHHSGLPEGRAKSFVLGELGGQPVVKSEDPYNSYHNLAGLLKEEYTAAPPNAIFSYSNLGYSLLGEVVTRMSKMKFEEYVKREILDPIGMKDSTFSPENANQKLISKGYLNGREINMKLIRDIPAGQMISSAHDMALFMMMLLNEGSINGKQILKRSTLAEMFRIQNANIEKDGDFKIGLGFWVHPTGSGMPYGRGHGGDIPPFHAAMTIIPEKKLGAVALINTLSSSMELGQVVNPALQLALETRTGTKIAPTEKATPTKINVDALKKYEGTYATPIGLVQTRFVGGELELVAFGATLRGTPYSDGSFHPYYRLLGFIPIHLSALEPLAAHFLDARGSERLQLSINDFSPFATSGKISPRPVRPQWMKRLGDYDILNRDSWTLFETFAFHYDKDSNFYFFEIGLNKDFMDGKKISIPLDTINDLEAVMMGDGRNLGETIRITVENGEEILHYSGFRLRKKK